MLYPAMRAARVDDNVRHALKALRVGLDFGRNFLAGLRASNHKNAHLTLASPRPRKSVKVPPREKWSKLLTLKIYFCPTFGLYGARAWASAFIAW